MSDFGAVIIFTKSGDTLTDDDKKAILENINDIVKNGEFSSHIKSKKYNDIYEWDEDKHCIKLTEYYEDEDSDDIREFAEEMDIEEAEEIIDILKTKINASIEMEAVFTDW